jgi:glycosyltransferase involved in cell wall biosynthesis
MVDLSIIIPARNEMFLKRTIEDILQNIEGNTEIIAVLDGYWPVPNIDDHPKVTLIHHSESIGQRAASNEAAKLAKGKYLMKVDAHCAFDKGFDVKMMADMKPNWTMVPVMRNLHAFNWVCPDGHSRYQGPSGPCKECKKETKMDVVWIPKPNPQSTAYRFDTDMHFQYQNERRNTAEYKYGVILGYRLSFDSSKIPLSIVDFFTNLANSHGFACSRNNGWFRKNMSSDAVSFSSIDNCRSIGPEEISFVRNKSKVGGITASSIVAKVINYGNSLPPSLGKASDDPGVENPMCESFFAETVESSISSFINSTDPVPTAGSFIKSDLIKQLDDIIGGQFVYSEKTNMFHNGSVTLTPIVDKNLNETMSIQGSCFMVTKERWFHLDICSEYFHSWGQQGVEVACKTWLSGGKVIVNRKP